MKLMGVSTYSSIGVDIGMRAIRAVQMKRRGSNVMLHRAVRVARRSQGAVISAAELAAFQQVLDRRGFVDSTCVAAVSMKQTLSGIFELPPKSSGAPIQKLVSMELARASKCEVSGIELHWWELPAQLQRVNGARAGAVTPVMAVGCPKAVAESMAAMFDDSGLVLGSLDTTPTALTRAAGWTWGNGASVGQLSAIIHLGWATSHLSILMDGTLVYERAIPECTLSLIQTDIAMRLSIDDEMAQAAMLRVGCVGRTADGSTAGREVPAIVSGHIDELAEQVRSAMSYAMRRFGSQLSRTVLTGSGCMLPGLSELLSTRCQTDVRLPTVPEGHEGMALRHRLGTNDSMCMGELMLSIGLSLNDIGGSAL